MAFSLANNKKFGIKEVADVKFYDSDDTNLNYDGEKLTIGAGAVAKFSSDSMKVSTFEFTGETVSARGGKGNSEIISWDTNKEITLNLEDAVITADALKLMHGTQDTNAGVFTIKNDSFPGTYAIVGKTYIRDEDGKDHFLTFYVPKAKIQPESTLTMEAEGDPSTFSMTCKVMKRGGDNADRAKDMVVLILEDNNTPDKTNPAIDWEEGGGVINTTSFTMNPTTLSMSAGGIEKVNLSIKPYDATVGVNWTSSANNVATVSGTKTGATITALAAGSATITAASTDGKTAKCEVTVA